MATTESSQQPMPSDAKLSLPSSSSKLENLVTNLSEQEGEVAQDEELEEQEVKSENAASIMQEQITSTIENTGLSLITEVSELQHVESSSSSSSSLSSSGEMSSVDVDIVNPTVHMSSETHKRSTAGIASLSLSLGTWSDRTSNIYIDNKRKSIVITSRKTLVGKDVHLDPPISRIEFGLDRFHRTRTSMTMLSRLTHGELPKNTEFDSVVASMVNNLDSNRVIVNHSGRMLLDNARNVLLSIQSLLHQKNTDEKLQRCVKSANLGMRSVVNTALEEMVRLRQIQSPFAHISDVHDLLDRVVKVMWFVVQSLEFRSVSVHLLRIAESVVYKMDALHGEEIGRALQLDRLHDRLPVIDGESATRCVLNRIVHDKEEPLIASDQLQRMETKLVKLLLRVGSEREHCDTIRHVAAIVGNMGAKWRILSANPKVHLSRNSNIRNSVSDLKKLVSEFTGSKLVDEWSEMLSDVINDLQHDENMRKLIKNVLAFSRNFGTTELGKSESEEVEALHSEFREFKNLIVTVFQSSPHENQIKELLQTTLLVLQRIMQDEDMIKVRKSMSQLMQSAVMDRKMRPDLFVLQDTIQQVLVLFLPAIRHHLKELPLPRIEGSNAVWSYVLEDLKLDCTHIFPERFQLHVDTKMDFKRSRFGQNMTRTKVTLSFENVCPQFQDFRFQYQRNVTPKFSDSGRANLSIQRRGIVTTVQFTLSKVQGQAVHLSLDRVRCKIDKLTIRFIEAKNILFNRITTKLFAGIIKRIIARRIESIMGNKLFQMVRFINSRLERKWILSRGRTTALSTSLLNEQLKKSYDGRDKLQRIFKRLHKAVARPSIEAGEEENEDVEVIYRRGEEVKGKRRRGLGSIA